MILIPLLSLGLASMLGTVPGSGVGGAPVAVDDFYTTPVDENLSQDAPGVLENDSDPENDPLSAVLVSSSGASGMLFLNPDGSFECPGRAQAVHGDRVPRYGQVRRTSGSRGVVTRQHETRVRR